MQHLQHRDFEALDKDLFDDIICSLEPLRNANCYPSVSTLVHRLFDFYVNCTGPDFKELREFNLSINHSQNEDLIWLAYNVEDVIEIAFTFQPIFVIRQPLVSYGSLSKLAIELLDLQTKTKHNVEDYRVGAVKTLLSQFSHSETTSFKCDSGDRNGRLAISLTMMFVGYNVVVDITY